MSIRRVAVIFDNTSRPETTGVYCRRALGGLVDVEHFLPTELSRVPRQGFDLHLFIDDGLRYPIPNGWGPSAYWAIDTHLDLDFGLQRGKEVDLVFAAQRDGAARLRARGISTATWLPLACDPEIHRKQDIAKRFDLAFVGNLVGGPRLDLVRLLQDKFPNSFVGQRYFEEMAQTYSASRIVFNRSILNDINMRVFEGLACGSLLLTNDLSENGQGNLFREGIHLATYRSPEEFLDKARYYLTHEAQREQMAAAGRAAVLARHTYCHRMRTVLQTAEQLVQRRTVAVARNLSELMAVRSDSDSSPVTAATTETVRKKEWAYFEYARPEVVALVPASARRILDIGSGAGRLGASLKARQPAEVTGIELNPDAAAAARQQLDRVIEGSVETAEIDFPEGSFDCVICADVLEHLLDPQKVLEKIRRWLTVEGCLVTSVPNARHHSVVRGLLEGNFTYESAGLLDETHLYFWTWRDLQRLLDRVGFSVGERQFVPGAEFDEWSRRGALDRIEEGTLRLRELAPGEGEQFHAYQYLIRATPIPRPEYGLTSIIVVTHNQWADTERCLASLREATDERYELIVVDNGSTDETVASLTAIRGLTLIANPQNKGFPAAVNQGIEAAQGEQILFLNNDVLLTSGWLRRLLAALHSSPEIGLVGPYTNCTAGLQRANASYALRELEDFAWRWCEEHRGRLHHVSRLTGFCLLLRRDVVDRVGILDERFGIGVYEDIDYCYRALQAGFRLAIAEDVYVHHFGHRSFRGAGIDQDALAVENEHLFREKWEGKSTPRLPRDAAATPEIDATSATLSGIATSVTCEKRELLELLPPTAQNVLVLGDGSHRLAEAIRGRTGPCVVSVAEPDQLRDPDSPAFEGATIVNASGSSRPFDCVIWPSLSASADPGKVISTIRRWLVPEGTLLTSVANVRQQEVVAALIRGTWAPVPPGSNERPLRFFTRREIEKLLFRHGFDPQSIESVTGSEEAAAVEQRQRGEIRLGGLSLVGVPPAVVEEFAAQRYLLQARPIPIPDDGLTSIILVTYNELRYTRACLDSLRLRTDEPYEVIIVDNGSTDGTVDYLRSLDKVTLIANPENRGFPAAANQGIRAAKGQNLLLLNNDTVVTTGWLRRLLDVFRRNPAVGLVGPCSNRCSGPQEVAVTYDRLDALDGFAWDWGRTQDRQTIEVDRLVGFCLLVRREVVDRIGLLDERFGIGNFEDDDFCRRGIEAGFRAVIAVDAFVHHFGSRSFIGSGVDFAGLLEENRRKYDAKWNVPSPEDQTASPSESVAATIDEPHRPRLTVKASPTEGFLLQRNPVRLSVCLIVRNNESTIGACLTSIQPWVDEIVVVDTGSQDRTPEICRQHGARLFEFPWCDDFSAARNESLRHARGEWIFWMDSDDTIPTDCGRRLRTLVDGPHPTEMLGYVVQVHCPGPPHEGSSDVTVVDHVKLIRNRPDLRFEGRIHEQLLPAIRRAEGDVAWTDLYVVHSGSDHSPEGWQRKWERDLRILHWELEEKPDHPFVLFNLGMTYADARRYDEAIGFLERCVDISRPEESHLRKAYALLVSALGQAERQEKAWEVCQRGLTLYPADKELLFRAAMLHHHFGRLRQAVQAYLQVLNESGERYFTSIVQGLAGYKARHNLAIVYDEMGCLDRAEQEWRRITRELPAYVAGWRGLGDVLLRRGDVAAVSREATQLILSDGILKREGILLRGRLAAARGDMVAAISDFEDADRLDPTDLEALQSLCRLRFDQDDLPDAERSLRELTRRAPTDAAAFHNLGSIEFRLCDFKAAERSLRKSLALRPESIDTRIQLGRVLVEAQRNDEACLVWQEVLRRAPHHPEATAALRRRRQFELPTAPR